MIPLKCRPEAHVLPLTGFKKTPFTLIKRKITFSSYIKIQKGSGAKSYITNGLLQSSYMVKYLHISSYIRKPFRRYDFTPDPI
jgi:hypothetical protein